MRRTYLGLAVFAAVIVYFANDIINGFLGKSSALGAIVLFAALPLAAILTRPVIVASMRGRQQRAIGFVYAIRTVRIRFFLASVGWWVTFMTGVLLSIGVLYREGELQAAAGVSNWWYLTNLFVLLLHLVPGQFRLPAKAPVTIVVAGPKSAGKSTFIGLLAIEELPRDWTVMPSASATHLLLNVRSRAMGGAEMEVPTGNMRLTFMRPRVWSKYFGTRPAPVDLIEVPELTSHALKGVPRPNGIAIVLAASGNIVADLQSQLRAIRTTDAMTGRRGRIKPAVAVVLTKSDLAPDAQLPPEARAALDQNCRRWESFIASDRGGEPSDVEGFSPKGYMKALLWLMGHS